MDWKTSLAQQSSSLQYLLTVDSLDVDIKSLLDLSREIEGVHYFTGVGKNMFVAARVAATYDSLGIRSLYVDPVNTLHGSMGIFTSKDILIAISKSGETEELNRFVGALRKLSSSRVVTVTANKESTLSQLADLTLLIPVLREGDHLGLAPISSTMLFSAVLDSIAVQLSSENGFGKSDFVRNHPGGSLGKTVL